MRKHLFTGSGAAPWEYVELVLCRDIYHCPPTDLERVPWKVATLHLQMAGIEAEVVQHKQKAATQGMGQGGRH